jgi:uncharacterized membrane protein
MLEFYIILGLILTSIGVLLYFIGTLNTIIIAFGKKQTLFGISIIVINPIAIVYCLMNWKDASTQGMQILLGLIIMSCVLIPAYMFYYKDIIFPN